MGGREGSGMERGGILAPTFKNVPVPVNANLIFATVAVLSVF
jgi:hypothetical protein